MRSAGSGSRSAGETIGVGGSHFWGEDSLSRLTSTLTVLVGSSNKSASPSEPVAAYGAALGARVPRIAHDTKHACNSSVPIRPRTTGDHASRASLAVSRGAHAGLFATA